MKQQLNPQSLKRLMADVSAGIQAPQIIKMGMSAAYSPSQETADMMIDDEDGGQVSGVFQGAHFEGGKIIERPIPATNPEKKIVRFSLVVESKVRNRYGYIVKADGWNLDNYIRNGVVLLSHNQWGLPIGKNIGIGVKGKVLQQAAQFTPDGLGADVHALYAGEFMRAWSAGFLPLKWETLDDGVDFLEQELWEASAVSVPADPNALSQNAPEKVANDAALMQDAAEILERINRKTAEFFKGQSVDYVKPFDEFSERLLSQFD